MIKLKLITGLSLAILAFAILTTNKMARVDDDPYLEGVDSITIINSEPSIQMYFYIKKSNPHLQRLLRMRISLKND